MIIKLVFGLALLLFICFKVYSSLSNEEFDNLVFSDQAGLLILAACILMPLNWLLETMKWHVLVNRLEKHSFKHTIRDVLAGISTSILTPNRIGNFIGRTINLNKDIRTKAVVSTIHSNLAQFTASIFFGLAGLFLVVFDESVVDLVMVRWSTLVVLAIGLMVYFFPKIIDFNPLSKLYSDQMKESITEVQKEPFSLKCGILALSLLRYCVFLIQFYLCLSCFQSDLDIQFILPAIAVVFLITTIIPSFLFGKLFIREASALFVLTSFGISTPAILYSVFILWFLNLAIPSMLGGLILMKSK